MASLRNLLPVTLTCMLVVSACQSQQPARLEDSLTRLGFYSEVNGTARPMEWASYGSDAQLEDLNWDEALLLGADDGILLYGELEAGPLGLPPFVMREAKGQAVPITQFFERVPLEPVRGEPLTRLVPAASVDDGSYSIVRAHADLANYDVILIKIAK